jgi:hypothetical protein
MSKNMQPHSIIGKNKPTTVNRVGGEGSVDEEDVDHDGQERVDEGLGDSLDVDVSTHNTSTLYPDYFDNFGNVRALRRTQCDSWCI